MNVRWLALLCFLVAAPVFAQGFGGLGTDAEGFAKPERGVALSFPRDHGAHPDYRIEWWYLTATLEGEDGREYGVQWTLFRTAFAPAEKPGWSSPQLWMGHAAITTPDAHFVAERRARGGTGQAEVVTTPFAARIDDWALVSRGGADAYDRLSMEATGDDFAFDLALNATGPLVRHGDDGYSVKSAEGQASYYYSQPFYEVSGTLTLPGGDVRVTGNAWLDREWSSQPLSSKQKGWDWLSLKFDDGHRMMGFQVREDGGGYTSATWIAPDGAATAISNGELELTPLETSDVNGRAVPTRWRVELPSKGIDVEVDALNDQAWMATSVPYWEGPVSISGSHAGRGYLEMTGY